jgi:hypothetical protein
MKDKRHIQSFNEHQENLNISDVSRSSYLENIMKKMALHTFTEDVRIDKGDYYYILSNDYIQNGDYIYNIKTDSISKLQDKPGLMPYMAYANTYTTKKIKYSNYPNMNFD